MKRQQTVEALFVRLNKELSSWACNTKVFMIFHRALQDFNISNVIAKDIKAKDHLLNSFQKKASDTTFDAEMYNELTNYYQSYIRSVVNYKINADLLTMRINDVSEIIRNVEMDDILFTYESFDAMIQILWRVFENQEFCSKTRLYQKVTHLMMKDLFQIYKVYYILIVEVLERFGELSNSDAKKAFVVYQNFVSLTKAMRSKCPNIMGKFVINMK